jgi:hypothetical protein
MSQQYVVPQFIDVEDKIIGPITTRQFVILLVVAMLMFVAYKMFDFALFATVGVFELAIGGILAFAKINGQPFHFFMLNLLQTVRKPGRRVWDKEMSDGELRDILKAPPPPPPPVRRLKARVESSKLSELTLVVNTGGVYNPEA